MSAPSSARLDRLVHATVALGAVVLLAAAAAVPFVPAPDPLALGLVALATLGLGVVAVTVRVGSQNETCTWGEVVVVVGLALLPPPVLVLSALWSALAYAAMRRSLVKVLFNTASHAVGLALASGATYAVGRPDVDAPVRSALALAAGAAAYSLWTAVSVNAAIAFAQGLPFRDVHRRNAGLRRLVAVGNTGLALGGLALAHLQPVLLTALPAGLALTYGAYRAYRSLQQDREVWRHLEASSRELGALDEAALAAVAVPRTAALLQADLVELTLYGADGDPDTVHAGAASGAVHVRVVRHGDLPDAAGDTTVTVPLVGRGAPVGRLLLRFGAPVRLSPRERQLLSDHARTLSAHLDNARLYAAVQARAAREAQAARHDPLTGLPNRLMLEEHGARAVQPGCAVLLIDLDRFKQVNDGYGHAAGDQLLRAMAGRLRAGVRPGDVVCRLGGDEFAVLLAERGAAEPTAERLAALLAAPVALGEVQVQVGASVGIATALPGEPFDALLRRADQAMYEAKGRSSAGRCSGFARVPVPSTGQGREWRREIDVRDVRTEQVSGAAAR